MYFIVHLLKKTQLNICYTIHGKLKINCDPDHGQVSAVINHDEDLPEIFGIETMKKVERERNPRR